jgi:hypothetical protein
MKPTHNCLTTERDTHKGATQLILFLFFYFFVAKIRRKVPHENIHGEASVLENFQKKNQIATFLGGKKKSFEIVTFEEEKNRF